MYRKFNKKSFELFEGESGITFMPNHIQFSAI